MHPHMANVRVVYDNLSRSGRGLVRLRRLTGGQEIASSNLVAPTIFLKKKRGKASAKAFPRFFFSLPFGKGQIARDRRTTCPWRWPL